MSDKVLREETGKSRRRWMSDRASIILIGAVAIGGIVLMCAIVAVILIVR
jgi:hypothetical protein